MFVQYSSFKSIIILYCIVFNTQRNISMYYRTTERCLTHPSKQSKALK